MSVARRAAAVCPVRVCLSDLWLIRVSMLQASSSCAQSLCQQFAENPGSTCALVALCTCWCTMMVHDWGAQGS